MSSFYGGKEGRTYHIVQRYDSVHDMVKAFSNGGAYTGANYGQYVIIDTVLTQGRSASKENGLLYRRGFDYNDPQHEKPIKTAEMSDEDFQQIWADWVQNPGAGAIYIGQIVGPEGRTPQLSIEHWSLFEQQNAEDGNFGSKNQTIMTPTVTGKQRDTIKVGYVNIVDHYGDITGGFIAFDIPELIIQTEIINHSPYSTAEVVEDVNSQNHPFWYKWNFTIPDGKHGIDLNKITIETGLQTKYNLTKDIQINNEKKYYIKEGNQFIEIKNPQQEQLSNYYQFSDNTNINNDQYLTYSIKDYTEDSEGVITEHLGCWPYRVINTINTNNNSRNSIIWKDGYEAKIGDLYRKNNYPINYYWICIKPGILEVNAHNDKLEDITIETDLGKESNLQNTIWRVVTIPQTTPVSSLTIDYKAGPSQNINELRTVDYLVIDKDGKVYVFYSTSNQLYYLTTLNTIEYITFDDDKTSSSYGKIILKYYGQDEVQLFNAHVLEKIEFKNQDINQSQYFLATFKGEEPISISENVNSILAFDRFNSDNMYILYSDPTVRDNLPENKIKIADWTDPITGKIYNNLKWYNLGSLGAQYHVQGNYTYQDLKTTLSHGFDNITGLEDRAGWLVTVLKQENVDGQILQKPHIYAFDYNADLNNPPYFLPDENNTPTCWYEIMSLNQATFDPQMFLKISEEEPKSTDKMLLDNMIWFIESYGHDNY